MFSTPQDILFVTLAVCAGLLTVFLCILLYQAIRTLRNANKMVEDVQKQVERVNDAIHFVQDKVDAVSNHMNFMQGAVGSLLEKFVVGAIGSQLKQHFSAKKKDQNYEEDELDDEEDLDEAFEALVKKKKARKK